MLNRIRAKLHSRAGESIGETLVALLISALALLMLAGAVSSAAKLVTRNDASMRQYYSSEQSGIKGYWDGKFSSIQ